MARVHADSKRRKRNLHLILPSADADVLPGATCLSVKFRASEKARLRDLTALLNRRAEGRRVYTMSSVIRYAVDVLYVDAFDLSPEVVNDRPEKAQ